MQDQFSTHTKNNNNLKKDFNSLTSLKRFGVKNLFGQVFFPPLDTRTFFPPHGIMGKIQRGDWDKAAPKAVIITPEEDSEEEHVIEEDDGVVDEFPEDQGPDDEPVSVLRWEVVARTD
jgi:hypothetical protein